MPQLNEEGVFLVKYILSEVENSAVIYCSSILSSERCHINIVHVGDVSKRASFLCTRALEEQRLWEIQRAYKDYGQGHSIKYLRYPFEDYEHALAAYLQINHMLGSYRELVYPKKYEHVCSKLKGRLELIPYQEEELTEEELLLQKKSLSRFKSIRKNY